MVVRYHHERYDGKGYPEGKSAEQLDLDVFIIQLADTIDAMSTDRPYRKALSHDEVIDEIIKFSGTQFHPKVVQAYLSIIEKQKKAV
jgi:HD-GYP domain-containing protein (c-di-GMP phosphodiesterase class II)